MHFIMKVQQEYFSSRKIGYGTQLAKRGIVHKYLNINSVSIGESPIRISYTPDGLYNDLSPIIDSQSNLYKKMNERLLKRGRVYKRSGFFVKN